MKNLSIPKLLLYTEGIVFFLIATKFYFLLGGELWVYLAFILAPDLGALGYLVSTKIGSYTYNALHFYTVPVLLGGYGFFNNVDILLLISLIWVAHIGIDRAIGYGLKYPTHFKETHLNRV